MIAQAFPLAPLSAPSPPTSGGDTIVNLIGLWYSQQAETTRGTYRQALEDLARFLKAATVEEAVGRLLTAGKSSAVAVLRAWRSQMHELRGLTPGTCNIRVAAVRSLLGFACQMDVIPWSVKIKSLKSRPYRDTRGPGPENVATMLKLARGRLDAKGARDAAMIRLLFDVGLRRMEVLGLDLEHLDLPAGRLWIRGKGRLEREAITLPQQTRDALAAWLEQRGDVPGPLFVGLSNHARGRRLTGTALHQVVAGLGKEIGIRTSPHRIRHSAGTEAAREEGIIGCQRFLRHSDPKISMIYVDNLEDVQGRVACRVAAALVG